MSILRDAPLIRIFIGGYLLSLNFVNVGAQTALQSQIYCCKIDLGLSISYYFLNFVFYRSCCAAGTNSTSEAGILNFIFCESHCSISRVF